MYCMKCGAQIPEDCAFCPRCGAQLRPAGPPPGLRPQSNKAKNRRIAIFVLAGCMVFFLLIQLFAVFSYRDVSIVTYDGSDTSKISAFVPVVLVFALILAGCIATMCLKKAVPCIVLSGVNLGLVISVSAGLMEIGKRMGAMKRAKEEALDALTILASCNIIYVYLALAVLILVILNRKTL